MATVETEKIAPHVRLLRLNRPERLNAMSIELCLELKAALEAIGRDNDCWIVILTGAGRAFCSGLDLKDYGVIPDIEGLTRAAHRAAGDARLLAARARAARDAAADPRRGERRRLRRRHVPLPGRGPAHRRRERGLQQHGHRERADQHRARRELAAAAPRRGRALERPAAHRPPGRRARGAAHGSRVPRRPGRRAAGARRSASPRRCAGSAPTDCR